MSDVSFNAKTEVFQEPSGWPRGAWCQSSDAFTTKVGERIGDYRLRDRFRQPAARGRGGGDLDVLEVRLPFEIHDAAEHLASIIDHADSAAWAENLGAIDAVDMRRHPGRDGFSLADEQFQIWPPG